MRPLRTKIMFVGSNQTAKVKIQKLSLLPAYCDLPRERAKPYPTHPPLQLRNQENLILCEIVGVPYTLTKLVICYSILRSLRLLVPGLNGQYYCTFLYSLLLSSALFIIHVPLENGY